MLFAALFPLPLSAGEKIVNINTRSGIALNLLMSTPESMNGTAIIMFPGGDGSSQFALEDGRIKRGDNFLMRTVPGFTNRGFLVVVVGMPSDRPEGMDDDFRYPLSIFRISPGWSILSPSKGACPYIWLAPAGEPSQPRI